MGLLDSIVGRSFRNEKAGRVVVFSGDRGYLVKSGAEELKIRSFLKMFFAAQLAVLLLGMQVANAWSSFIINLHEMGRPAAHLIRSEGVFLGIYSLVVGIPYFLLWRSYRKGLLSFVSGQDEVAVTTKGERGTVWMVVAGFAVLALVALGLLFLVRAK
jgi:hypothetical protein